MLSPLVWVLGEAPPLSSIARALQARGHRVERGRSGGPDAWSPTAEGIPNLLVVGADLALAEDAALLRKLDGHGGAWGCVPRVVVSATDDVDRCQRAYALGAASWVVIAEGAPGVEAASIFARYWADTILLPELARQIRA